MSHSIEVSELPKRPNIGKIESQKSQLWQYHNVEVSDDLSAPKSTNIV